MARFHLTDDGPKVCTAQQRCPLGGDHYDDLSTAQRGYEQKLSESYGFGATMMDLPCAFGVMRVVDGDLSDFEARNALISGLCGDLAQAIQARTGAPAYLVCYGVETEDELAEEWRAGRLVDTATHAVVESSAAPGEFVDAYGRKSAQDLKDFYGDDATILKVTPEMLKDYGTGAASKLGRFAESAERLDASGESYSYDNWG